MLSLGLSRQTEQPFGETAQDSCCGFSGAVISDVGCVKEKNEDNFVFERNSNRDQADRCRISVSSSRLSEQWHIAGVFDGVGGGEMGEAASGKTAEIFLGALAELARVQTRTEVDMIMQKTFLEANNQIVSLQQERKIVGTTATVLCTNGREFKLYHLGDSRGYLARDGAFAQITKDHTLAQMKLDAGIYRKDDPLVQTDKYKLTEFLGRDRTREHIRPEESPWFSVREGDRLLLCSDGLTNLCPDEAVFKILEETFSAADAAEKMVDMARRNGGSDNITCMVIDFRDGSDGGM